MFLNVSSMGLTWNEVEDVSIYKGFYIFEWTTENQIKWIIRTSPIESFELGQVVMTEWDEPDWKAYLILDWFVKIVKDWKEIAILNKWDIFWEFALICDEPRSATVIIWANMHCMVLSKDQLLDLSNLNSVINDVIIKRFS